MSFLQGKILNSSCCTPMTGISTLPTKMTRVTTVVDTETRKVIAQINVGIEPEGMAVSPDGKIAITTSETTNMAHWIDTETRKLFANTLVDSRPRHAEFTAGGTELWVSSEIGGTITVFDVETQAEKGKIEFEVKGVHPDRVQPVGFEFTADEKTAFVALGPSNHVAVVNAETLEVEDYILVGRRVWHMDFSPDKSLLFYNQRCFGGRDRHRRCQARSHQVDQGRSFSMGRRAAPLIQPIFLGVRE